MNKLWILCVFAWKWLNLAWMNKNTGFYWNNVKWSGFSGYWKQEMARDLRWGIESFRWTQWCEIPRNDTRFTRVQCSWPLRWLVMDGKIREWWPWKCLKRRKTAKQNENENTKSLPKKSKAVIHRPRWYDSS